MKVVVWVMIGLWVVAILGLFSELAAGADSDIISMSMVFAAVQIWINWQFIKILDKKR